METGSPRNRNGRGAPNTGGVGVRGRPPGLQDEPHRMEGMTMCALSRRASSAAAGIALGILLVVAGCGKKDSGSVEPNIPPDYVDMRTL